MSLGTVSILHRSSFVATVMFCSRILFRPVTKGLCDYGYGVFELFRILNPSSKVTTLMVLYPIVSRTLSMAYSRDFGDGVVCLNVLTTLVPSDLATMAMIGRSSKQVFHILSTCFFLS